MSMPRRENDTATIELEPNGILIFRYKPGVSVDLEAAKKVVALAAELVDKPAPNLIDIGAVTTITREARAFFADSPENNAISKQAAMLIRSAVGQMIGKFFMGPNKPTVPSRLFTNEEEAIMWLLSGPSTPHFPGSSHY